MAANPALEFDPTQPIPDTPKTGLLTTEGWVTLLTMLLPAVTMIFHQDFSGQLQVVAAAAAGVTAAAYTISRALTKSAQVKASAQDRPRATLAVAQAQGAPVPAAAPALTDATAAAVAQVQADIQQLAALLRDAQPTADGKADQNGNGDKRFYALLG